MFFCGLNVGADTVAHQTLDRQLSQLPVDIRVSLYQLYNPLSMGQITSMVDEIHNLDIDEIVQIEVITRDGESAHIRGINQTAYFRIVGISENSKVYNGLKVREDGSSSLGANETYVWADSKNSEDLRLGDVLEFSIRIRHSSSEDKRSSLTLSLKVTGFVDLEDEALKIAKGHYSISSPQTLGRGQTGENLLIVDWKKTFANIIDAYYHENLRLDTEVEALVFLNRHSVINPWNIDVSMERISTITSQIRNTLSLFTNEWIFVYNHFESVLDSYRTMARGLRIQFIVTALPVFFVAWYMGTTASEVSYNLRRREVGLLLTKGFSRLQLLRIFFSEAALVGLIGGMIGIALSLVLVRFSIQTGGVSGGTPVIGTDTIIFTVVFSAALSLFSVFQPARRASKLDVVDALQEYRYVEGVKPYRKMWPWIALILGSYKIVVWLLGINTYGWLMRPQPMQNVLAYVLFSAWIFFDAYALSYAGPILFLWGLTKILIRGSLKFQEFAARLVKPIGDLWVLSITNVRRNPARTAAIAFLIAMIMGYSFQIMGTYASEKDFNVRKVRLTVGSDISVRTDTTRDLSSITDRILELSGVSALTLEYRFFARSAEGREITLLAVDPQEWLDVAHCEIDLFLAGDVISMFTEMGTDSDTIILEKRLADALGLGLGDKIVVKFGSSVFNLRIVGLLVPGWTYGSYVPQAIYHSAGNDSRAAGRILIRLTSDADGKAVAEQIRSLQLTGVSAVYSVPEILVQQEDPSRPIIAAGTNLLPIGEIEIQRLGVAFAVLAASLGAVLVTIVSLTERRKEIGMMRVRGLSFRQIVGVILTENLTVMAFAVVLGAVVGLIVVQGHTSSLNTLPNFSTDFAPILRHVVFPLDSALTLASCCILVFASAVVPVVLAVRRYISETERIVREP